MQYEDKTRVQLIHELGELRKRAAELEASEAESKETIELLFDCKEKYYDFFKNSRDAHYITDRDGRFVDANQSFLGLFGYTREELKNLKAQETYVNHSDRRRLQRKIEQKGLVVDYAVRLRKKDGTELDCLITATVRRANDESILGYQGIIRDTTERKRMEEKIKENENKYRELVDLLPVVVFELDERGNVTFANRQGFEIFGYTPEELEKGLNVLQFVIPEESDTVEQNIRKIINGEKIIGKEYTALKKDGSTFPVILYSGPIIADNRAVGLRGIVVDVTERKQVEEVLRESRERFRSLVESVSDWIWEVNQNGVYTYASPKVKDILGYEPEEIIGKTPFELMPPDEAERVGAIFRDIVASERPFERLTNVNLHKDGQRVILETNGVPVFDKNGNLLGYRGIDRDVTERKQVEQDLLESRLRYRTLFENAPVGIGLATFDGHVLAGNQAMYQMTGYSEADMGKLHVRDFYANPKDRRVLLRRLLRGEPVREFEARMKRKDGTPFDASLTINRITVDDKGAFLTMIRDITTHKESEKKLLSYQQQLRSLATELPLAEERERRRIATYLHDHIGHGLAMCKIKLGLLRESISPIHRDGYLDDINGIIEQAIQCTRSLTSELSPPVLYEMGLVAAVEWLAENVSEQYGIQITVKNTRQFKRLNGNLQILLFQAARELLTNIVKHAQAQKVEIYIRRYKEDKIQIEVKDDGVGFDTSHLLSNITKNGGFGLFNIRERFNHLGGYLDIQSQPGCGTRVTIVAPLETTKS